MLGRPAQGNHAAQRMTDELRVVELVRTEEAVEIAGIVGNVVSGSRFVRSAMTAPIRHDHPNPRGDTIDDRPPRHTAGADPMQPNHCRAALAVLGHQEREFADIDSAFTGWERGDSAHSDLSLSYDDLELIGRTRRSMFPAKTRTIVTS